MTRRWSRRAWLHAVGGSAVVAPFVGCSSTPGSSAPDAFVPPVDAPSGDMCGPAPAAWASGGTSAMTAKDCYPNPFAAPVVTCPLLVCETTAGPCTAPAPERVDVSEGRTGLPVRLALELVTAETCTPIAGAVVEIWHTQVSGVYSGQTPSPGFCSGGDADAPNHSYFRGTQTTDANGRIAFDTCFPGWYPGRAIHIHFSVTISGTRRTVSQLFFDDTLVQSIFATHPDYTRFGQPDRNNTNDGVIGGAANFGAYVLDTARMSDGAMLASKRIAIRDAGQPSCTA